MKNWYVVAHVVTLWKSELGTGVCPACGLPHTPFLNLIIESICQAIISARSGYSPRSPLHLSQTFVAMMPSLMIFHLIFPNFFPGNNPSGYQLLCVRFPADFVTFLCFGSPRRTDPLQNTGNTSLKSKIIYSLIIVVLAGLVAIFVPSPKPIISGLYC